MNGTKTAPAALQRDEGQNLMICPTICPDITSLRRHARRLILGRIVRQMSRGLAEW